jgi:hypothetical protein
MQASLKMPPPTLEEVRTHFKASAQIRKKLTGNQPASLNGRRKATPS